MSIEIKLFLLNSSLDCDPINNVLLRSVLDSDETKSQVDIFTLDHSLSIGSFVHDIDFSDNTDGSNTLWINFSCDLKTIRGGHISIGWKSTQNDGSWVTNISHSHCTSDLLNIVWLIRACHWNSSDTWQIN